MSHWVSVSAVRIKVASHLATLNHFAADLGILKRQRALADDGELKTLLIEQLGRKGELFNALKEEVYAGILQWESSGYTDPKDEEDLADEDERGEE